MDCGLNGMKMDKKKLKVFFKMEKERGLVTEWYENGLKERKEHLNNLLLIRKMD